MRSVTAALPGSTRLTQVDQRAERVMTCSVEQRRHHSRLTAGDSLVLPGDAAVVQLTTM